MTRAAKETMVAILFRVQARPGKRAELLEFLEWDKRESLRSEPGTVRFDLFQDPLVEDAFYVYEAYEDAAALAEHKKNPPFLKWISEDFTHTVKLPEQVLENPPS
jgi:quinol monooxygenase YgiN